MTKKPAFFTRKAPVQPVHSDAPVVAPVKTEEPVKVNYRMPAEPEKQKPIISVPHVHIGKLPHIPKISVMLQALLTAKNTVFHLGSFVILLLLYTFGAMVSSFIQWKLFPKKLRDRILAPYLAFDAKIVSIFDRHAGDTISRVGLIELAFRNMKAKRTRTIVTIGGMTIGIGAIVFLVSIGYGLQQLVITRVARLSEMKQIDVTPQPGGKTKITDKTVADAKGITNVTLSLPLIAVVGRVNYQNSVSDMAVYGVTSDYLKESAIKPVQGMIFESNDIAFTLPPETASPSSMLPTTESGTVAGAATDKPIVKEGEFIRDIDFTLHPDTWTKVRSGPTTGSPLIGYSRRMPGTIHGKEVWGAGYVADDGVGDAGISETNDPMGKWIQSDFFLWEQKTCTKDATNECENGKYMPMRDDAKQQQSMEGYIAEVNVQYQGFIATEPQVLGDETTASESADTTTTTTMTESSSDASDSATFASTDDLSWIDIASEAGIVKPKETKTIALHAVAKKEAVVNRAMLQVLGLKDTEAIGKKFQASFIVVGNLLSDGEEKLESSPADYTIVGVTPDDKTPVFYVPFIDLRSLGVVNFSQMKIVVNNQSNLTKVRRQIESMGFTTQSVVDTVAQINALFATLRTVLLLLGMVALAVASLGMFNTLTVSLLERTREVGLMKAMGMKSSEVQELFLTESMIMGFFGGIIGLLIGIVGGKLFSLLLSLLAVMKGVGFIDVSYVPLSFIIVIVTLSFIVGILTGIYPARRATKISALNALRYE